MFGAMTVVEKACPPSAPRLRPAADPFADLPEFPLLEELDTPTSVPRAPRLRPAMAPMDVDQMSDLELPRALDEEMQHGAVCLVGDDKEMIPSLLLDDFTNEMQDELEGFQLDGGYSDTDHSDVDTIHSPCRLEEPRPVAYMAHLPVDMAAAFCMQPLHPEMIKASSACSTRASTPRQEVISA